MDPQDPNLSLGEVNTRSTRFHGPTSLARAWIAVLLLSILYIVSFVDRLVLALMIEPIKAELAVSDVQIGLLIGSSFAVFYTLASIPLARIADSGDRRVLIAVGAAAWGAMTVASAFADSFTVLLMCRIGVGLGEAALVPAAMSLIADLFPRERRSLPTTVFVTIGGSGAAGAMILGAIVLQWAASADFSMLPALADLTPWRVTLVFVGLPAIFFAGVFAALVREPKRKQISDGAEMSIHLVLEHLFDNRLTYVGFLSAATIIAIVNYSVFAWFPSHLIRMHAISAPSAGLLFGGIGVGATLAGGFFVPYLADRLARRGWGDAYVLVPIAAIVLIAPLLAIAASTANLSVALFCIAPSLFLQLGVAVLFASTSPLLSPGRYRAQMVALFFFFVNLVGFGLGPPLVAKTAEMLFTGPDGIGKALALTVLILMPVQIALLLWSRMAFRRTLKAAAESENALLNSHPGQSQT